MLAPKVKGSITHPHPPVGQLLHQGSFRNFDICHHHPHSCLHSSWPPLGLSCFKHGLSSGQLREEKDGCGIKKLNHGYPNTTSHAKANLSEARLGDYFLMPGQFPRELLCRDVTDRRGEGRYRCFNLEPGWLNNPPFTHSPQPVLCRYFSKF